MTNTKSNHLRAVAALLAAALAMMLFYTTQQQGYHVDELYTYELTNYPGSFYALSGGFVLYGYIYNADDLLTLAESALPVAHAELLTNTARCPVYYIKLK